MTAQNDFHLLPLNLPFANSKNSSKNLNLNNVRPRAPHIDLFGMVIEMKRVSAKQPLLKTDLTIKDQLAGAFEMKIEEQDGLISLLDDRIRKISKEVVQELQSGNLESASFAGSDSELHKLGDTLRRIMVKEFVSVREAALLLNCSDGHVRNLVNKAQRGKAPYPIPFLDLDGVTVFSRAKLLEWAAQPKRKLRAVS